MKSKALSQTLLTSPSRISTKRMLIVSIQMLKCIPAKNAQSTSLDKPVFSVDSFMKEA